MALFRRFRKDKDESTAEDGKSAEEAPVAPSPASPKPASGPAPAAEVPAPSTPAPVAAPASLPPSSPPPPRLPEKPPTEAVRSPTDRGPFGVCFVCGSVLENGTCPTCRIAWVE